MSGDQVVDNLYPDANELEIDRNRQKMERLESLKGKTIEVYHFMLEESQESYGVREIQRALEYSSPSVASYHLNRLCEYQLVEKLPNSLYRLDGDPVKLGPMKDHIQVMGLIIPRLLAYAYNAAMLIIVSLILYILGAPGIIWFGTMALSNLIFIAIILRDNLQITGKLRMEQSE